jgi:hypothetical protein
MACISLGFIENILIWLVVLGAILALVNLLLPLVLGPLGAAGATIIAALRIVVWAIVCVFVIIVVFDLASCLLGSVRLHG